MKQFFFRWRPIKHVRCLTRVLVPDMLVTNHLYIRGRGFPSAWPVSTRVFTCLQPWFIDVNVLGRSTRCQQPCIPVSQIPAEQTRSHITKSRTVNVARLLKLVNILSFWFQRYFCCWKAWKLTSLHVTCWTPSTLKAAHKRFHWHTLCSSQNSRQNRDN